MKNILLIPLAGLLLFVLNAGTALSQSTIVERSFNASGNETIDLNLKFGEAITIKAWDKSEVAFRAVIDINGGKLNDALILDFNENSNGLFITSEYDRERIRDGRREDCPDKSYSTYSLDSDRERSVVCSNITYEIWVPAGNSLKVESISSNIELVGLKGPVKAKSISGFVDLSWAESNNAELSVKTISGEVYSGLEQLALSNQKRDAPLVGYEIRGSIGSGGPRVSLESISGNIYLRKVE
jgi:hypothetical protein